MNIILPNIYFEEHDRKSLELFCVWINTVGVFQLQYLTRVRSLVFGANVDVKHDGGAEHHWCRKYMPAVMRVLEATWWFNSICTTVFMYVSTLLFSLVRVVTDFMALCVSRHLNESLDEFNPDLIVYIAGTAVLSTDEAGGLCLSPQVCLISAYFVCRKWLSVWFIGAVVAVVSC